MSARGERIRTMPGTRFLAWASGLFLAAYLGECLLEWCAHAFGALS